MFATEARVSTDKARYDTITTPTPDEEVIDYRYDSFIDVTYSMLPGLLYCGNKLELTEPGQDGILYVTEEFEPETDFITFDYRGFFWKDANGDCNLKNEWDRGEEGGFRLNKLTIKRTVEGYLKMPPGALTWEGKIHGFQYTSDLNLESFAKNTLLFQDVKFRRGPYNYITKSPTFAIDATLVYRPGPEPTLEDGWNLFPMVDDSIDPARIVLRGVCYMGKTLVALPKSFEPFISADMSDFLFSQNSDPLSPSFKADSLFTPLADNVCPAP
jgi:hypothetical protein